ncbi:MAG: MBL fold metallo-hydrolase, partial [Propionibacteriaceae bacterium]|nr:MBL fold metallo-hydrolase [Propionibacteriaceae bacterium]
MQISHLGHAAVLVETAGCRILLDPGDFSSAWHGLAGLDAIVVTHQHADHIDQRHLPGLLAANPEAVLLAEPSVPDKWDLPSARRFAAGSSHSLGRVRIAAVGGSHAVIHRDIPRIGNIGIVIEAPGEPRFFHPGDALDAVPAGVDV